MSKQRLINTKFWDDAYISNLDPIEKLLFLYLLSNPLTNILGIYEIELRRIAFDTGIDKDMILKIFERFEKDCKVVYVNGHIVIINFLKHQNIQNPKMKAGVQRVWAEFSDKVKSAIADRLRGMDRVCIGYLYSITLNYTILNLTILNEVSDSICAVEAIRKKHLFANSPVSDFKTFRDKFVNNPNYADYDTQHYYNAVKNWSSAKVEYSADWIATAYSFVMNDVQRNKAVKNKIVNIKEIARLAVEGKTI